MTKTGHEQAGAWGDRWCGGRSRRPRGRCRGRRARRRRHRADLGPCDRAGRGGRFPGALALFTVPASSSAPGASLVQAVPSLTCSLVAAGAYLGLLRRRDRGIMDDQAWSIGATGDGEGRISVGGSCSTPRRSSPWGPAPMPSGARRSPTPTTPSPPGERCGCLALRASASRTCSRCRTWNGRSRWCASRTRWVGPTSATRAGSACRSRTCSSSSAEHGFPVRAVIAGVYGHASACNWLVDIELATFAARKAYWVERGYSPKGLAKIESKLDTPASFAQLRPGPARPGYRRRLRMAPDGWDPSGPGTHRRRSLAGCQARRRRVARHLVAVALLVVGDTWLPHPGGPRHRQPGRGAKPRRGPGVSRRRERAPVGCGPGELSKSASTPVP